MFGWRKSVSNDQRTEFQLSDKQGELIGVIYAKLEAGKMYLFELDIYKKISREEFWDAVEMAPGLQGDIREVLLKPYRRIFFGERSVCFEHTVDNDTLERYLVDMRLDRM